MLQKRRGPQSLLHPNIQPCFKLDLSMMRVAATILCFVAGGHACVEDKVGLEARRVAAVTEGLTMCGRPHGPGTSMVL